jgi:2,3-dihydroxybenzoate-AMP ligase/mycobactin salicyl-AMP ligase
VTTLDGFTPYRPEDAALYTRKRWWLGLTLGDVLDRAADLHPDREALVGFDAAGPGSEAVRYTWARLRAEADLLAYRLLESGLRRGDRVLLQLPNRVEFVVAYFALQKAGLVMVLLTVNHTAREVAHLARLTEPRGWVVPARYRKTQYGPLIAQVRAENPGLAQVVVLADDGMALDDPGFAGTLRYADLVGALAATTTQAEVAAALEAARPEPGDVCQILPSGGTTGLPKGAPRTHDDYLNNVEYCSKAWDLTVTDTCLVATTVGHNLALLISLCGPVFHAARMVVIDSTYPEDICRAIAAERVTCAALVPTLVSRLVAYDGAADHDLSTLERVYVGAANSPPDLVQSVERRLGCRYVNAFGMVEGPCSQSRPEDAEWIRCETIGRPVNPYDEFVILDPEGRQLSPGQEGELAAKGPGIFTGYYKNPQANKDAFTPDGYFRTGDLARRDENGYLRITGRLKDIIIRGGENIAARDVEDLISSHAAVEYAAVVGMPDKDLGETVCAYVTLVAGANLTLEDIHAHLRAEGASNALLPARLVVVDSIPLTAAGKADKKELRARLAQPTGPTA